MADIYNLEIVAMGNNTNADPTKLLIDENQVQGAILGKLTGFAPGEDVSKLTFAPSNVAGGNGDSSGRFGLMKVTDGGGVTEWLLYVKDAREFNHEYSFGEFEDILNELTFAASSALGDYTATLSIELRDLNEAPEDIVFSGAQPVQVGMAAGSNVLKATASDDPDINNPDGFGINEYVFKNGTDSGQFSIDPSGLFRIHKTTGQITTADALDSGDAGVHDLFVQIRDTTNPNVFREEKVPVTVTANTAPGAVTVAPGTSVDLAENSAAVTVVVTSLTATDQDGDAVSYVFAGANPATPTISPDGKFQIVQNGSSWQIQTTQSFNYETDAKSYDLNVQAKDSKGATGPVTTVKVNVTNVNEAPSAVAASQSQNIAEDAAGGTVVVASLTATDPDAGDTVSYVFAGTNSTTSPDGKFEIFNSGGNTWGIRLKAGQSLDFETAQSHTFSVQAKDSSGATGPATPIVVNVTNVNEAPHTVRLNNATSVSVPEDTSSMTVLGTLSATDPDGNPLTYTFSNNLATSPDGKFEIFSNGNSWGIRLAAGQTLDFETAQSHTLNVVAKDVSSSSVVTSIIVNVTDKNEAPSAVVASPGTSVSVEENSAAVTVVVTNLTATDQDGDTVSYVFAGANPATPTISPDGKFQIVLNGSSWQIQTTQSFDYETDAKSYDLNVQAKDSSGATGPMTKITVSVTDVVETPNNLAPGAVSINGGVSANVAENAAAATVGTLSATDPNGDAVSYQFAGANPAASLFEIVQDSSTNEWQIRLKQGQSLDYEAGSKSFDLNVQAKDSHGATGPVTTIKVNVTDMNDAPSAVVASPSLDIAEDAVGGEVVVASLTATDPDAGDAVSYVFVGANPATPTISPDGKFEIFQDNNTNTWGIRLKAGQSLDFETAQSHTFSVQAKDGSGAKGPAISITVNVTDVNEAPGNTAPHTVRVNNAASVNVAEDATNAAVVGNLTATDAQGDTILNYTFSDGSTVSPDGKFEIVNSGGAWKIQLVSGQTLDHEGVSSYSFDVKATDSHGLTGPANTITVNVTNVNEAPTDLVFADPQNVQAGLTKAGALVVDANVVDPDAPASPFSTYHYMFDNGAQVFGKFTIDSNTGQITTNADIDDSDVGAAPTKLKVVAYEGSAQTPNFSITKEYDLTVAESNAVTWAITSLDAVKAEGNTGTTDFTFTITRSNPNGAGSIAWNIDGIGANATNGGDFNSLGGTVDFVDGQTSQTLTIKVSGDTLPENDEAFAVKLSNPSTGTIIAGSATGIINNDDGAPSAAPVISISATDTTKYEAHSGTTTFTFMVTRDSSVGYSAVKMIVVGTGADPAATTDFEGIKVEGIDTDIVEFFDGQMSKTVTVLVKGDAANENDEDFSIILLNRINGTISLENGTAGGLIRDDDNAPTDITLTNASVRELPDASMSVVGTLGAVDSDPPGSTFTYTLLGDAGGRFELGTNVDGTITYLQVKNAFLFDFEQAQSHTVKVQVTDNTGHSYVEDLVISVADWAAESTKGSSASNIFKGGLGKDTLGGGSGNDKLYGGGGNDKLTGGSGNDYVWGGAGKDALYGSSGKDYFVFDTFNAKTNKSTNVDAIKDFKVKDDSIYLDNAVFKALGKAGTLTKPAKMKADAFWTGSKANDKEDRIIYDNKKGILYYDADGSGKGAAVQIATITKNLKMNEKDFFII